MKEEKIIKDKGILSISNLSVFYGKHLALDNISLDIYRKEIFLIIGHNGAGKTTLVNACMGIISKVEGDIILSDKSIVNLPIRKRLELGIALVPQGKGIFNDLTVLENLIIAHSTMDKRVRQSFQDKLEKIFTLFPDLFKFRKEFAGKMSGGQQRMLAISMALIKEPKILLMDEPSLGLSPALTEKIYDFITLIIKDGEITIVLIEQDVFRASQISNRVCILRSGRLINILSPLELDDKLLWEAF